MFGGPRGGRGSFLLAAGVSSARRRTGMQGSLGEKIGEGAFSEAYAWAPGQVVKLFKAGHISRGTDGGSGAVFAHRPHLRGPRQRGAFLAGAADPAHTSGAALGRLNRLGRAREPKRPVEARHQCLLWA